ncbi:MAG: magnesium/cobalt transporter CorA [Chthoniobacteraceae bacterium]|nr:magnesium/cobalt transporter CorA [Chthoniobacteraceae bacterium]
MFANAYHPPGTPPATLVPGAKAPVLTLIQYDGNAYEERRVEKVEDLFGCRASGKVNWIDLDGLGDVEALNRLGAHFGLHPLALEDVLHAPQRPKIEEYPGHFFIVTQIPVWNGDAAEVVFEQASLFFGADFLITIQENPATDIFGPVRTRLRSGRGFARTRGHDYLAYAILDSIVDQYFPLLERLGESIETLEDDLLERPSREGLVRLHTLKRSLMRLRRNIWPLRDLFATLTRDESTLVSADTKLFLRDCYDHAVRLMDVVETYRDLTASMMDIYLSSVGMRTNEVMRVLTVVSTIFIPLTFLAGVYGMNFEAIPGAKSPVGFWICVAAMGTLAIGMLTLFRSKKWI